jgi:hypothetical protein
MKVQATYGMWDPGFFTTWNPVTLAGPPTFMLDW